MKRLLDVPLRVKILGLIVSLIILIIGLITVTYSAMEYEEEIAESKESVLQTARTLSYMPNIQNAVSSGNVSDEVKLTIAKISKEIDAAGIIINNKHDLLYTNVSTSIAEELEKNRDTYQAIVFGSAYVRNVTLNGETFILGIAPISIDYDSHYQIEGVVNVVFNEESIKEEIFNNITNLLFVSVIALIVGIIGGVMLTRSIQKDTLGLEPFEIATLYKQRIAIIHSIKEGIIAVNPNGRIDLMNNSAKTILGVEGKVRGFPLERVFQQSKTIAMLKSPDQINDIEIQHNGKSIIVNTMPVVQDDKKIGMVASFRDKTEIKNMINTISEVKQYSEDLRAQTHEFANKLYVLLGLLQLGKNEEAMDFIREITKIHEWNSEIIFNHIQDEKVQAILVGKLAKASENKLQFSIHQESSLQPLSKKFGMVPLLTIIGNLIDNGFEAITAVEGGEVVFFTTDVGNDILFEVTDNGSGINKEIRSGLFQKGTSEKGVNRGYGLSNVKHEVEQLGGTIEFDTGESGTIFTVFIPKN